MLFRSDFRKHCRDFFALGTIDAAQFSARVAQMLHRYPAGIVQGQLNLLDSHDVSRFLSLCGGDVRRLRLAEVFLFTSPGAPCVFYGDELGIAGITETDYRSAMPWGDPPCAQQEFFRSLTSLRQENEALVSGAFRSLWMEGSFYIYCRKFGDIAVIVALNAGPAPVQLPPSIAPSHSPILCHAYERGRVGPFGYVVWK